MLDLGRDITSNTHTTHTREWLVTNGIGGYATGTLSGALTRVYHGLLVAALAPPLGRTVLLSKLDEVVSYDGQQYDLHTNQWAHDDINPLGYHYIESFHLEGTTPVWTYAIQDALLEKRVWMQYGSNTTYIRYTYKRGTLQLNLLSKAIATYKDSHNTITKDDLSMQVETVEHGLKVTALDGAAPYYVFSDRADVKQKSDWYTDYYLAVENARGLDDVTDNLHIGTFGITLNIGESVSIVATTDPDATLDSDSSYTLKTQREQSLINSSELTTQPGWIQHLVLAADQFIVQRKVGDNPDGRSVIAGYHWFGDWGRDTMIALSGLTLTTKRYDEAKSILRTYAQFVDKGMLPNRFPDHSEQPEYNTVDATLWYFVAIQKTIDATGDMELLRELYPVLQSIIEWHIKGTRYNIKVDPDDGLLYHGEDGKQLTWMDAKIKDWVVTPRTGKAVEINALWYNALRTMADFARQLGELDADEYDTLANRTEEGFQRFWSDDHKHCYDVIDTPEGNDDPSLRPNQIFAVSLEHSPLTPEQRKQVVDACARQLVTSIGLRSLAPSHADYKGDYGGDPYERDSRYHQGTVWAWLIGHFVEAYLHVYNDKATVRSFLEPFEQHLTDYCIGSITEVAQGDPPFKPKAAIAQAWSVAEVLRAWVLCTE